MTAYERLKADDGFLVKAIIMIPHACPSKVSKRDKLLYTEYTQQLLKKGWLHPTQFQAIRDKLCRKYFVNLVEKHMDALDRLPEVKLKTAPKRWYREIKRKLEIYMVYSHVVLTMLNLKFGYELSYDSYRRHWTTDNTKKSRTTLESLGFINVR